MRRRAPGKQQVRGTEDDRPVDDDRLLMGRLAQRDVAALEALYDRHASMLYAFLMRMLANAAEAEEILHEVFWRAWSQPDRYQPRRGSPRVYFVQLARSRALDRLRRERRRRDLLEESGAAVTQRLQNGAQIDPWRSAVSGEERARLQWALSGLPDRQRRAVVLNYFDGLSHREIAEQLGEPLGTVKTRIRGGLARMRDRLEAAGAPKAVAAKRVWHEL